MSDIIDINVTPTIEEVTINTTEFLTTINVTNQSGGGGGATNLSLIANPTNNIVTNSNGNGFTIPLAGAVNAGLITATEKTKIETALQPSAIAGFATTTYVNQQDNLKVDKVTGKSLVNDTEITKLAGIEAGAEANVNADWNATSGDAEILNKPTIPSITGLVPYTGATSDVDLGENQIKSGQIELDQTPTGVFGVGKIRWNDTEGTAEIRLKGNNVTLQIGQELVKRVVNKTTTNITLQEANYQVVKIIGAAGQRLSVDLAQANTSLNTATTLGVVTETIANNQEGFITYSGEVNGINTTGSLQGETWADGDVLYLSPTIAGSVTNIKPIAPNHSVIVGYVEHAHNTNGKIFVKIDNGYELEDLHNVSSTSYNSVIETDSLLVRDTTNSIWKRFTFANLKTWLDTYFTATKIRSILGITTLSGSNTGDDSTNTTSNAYADAKVTDAIIDGVTTVAPSQNAVFDALATKENTITAGTTSQYFRGDKTFQILDKTAVGLSNVDNTSDVNKPVSAATQTALNAKADLVGGLIPSSQLPSYVDDVIEVADFAALPITGEVGKIYVLLDSGELYRWTGSLYVEISQGVTLHNQLTLNDGTNPHGTTKSDVGLSNADNTSDLNKPVSNATQTALNTKQDTLVSGTNIRTVNGNSILGSGDLLISANSVPTYSASSFIVAPNTQVLFAEEITTTSTSWIEVQSGAVLREVQ
jgi:hypothetical protein